MEIILVDIHNHILPGIDDGPINDEETLQLVKNAAENGITHIIATPHHRNGTFNNNAPSIKYLVNKLNTYLKSKNIPITIFAGMEIHLHDDLLNDINSNLLSLADRKKYMLIELPTNHLPQFTSSTFFEMQLRGYIPIIAHPERNTIIRQDPNRLFELVNSGALVQLNSSSITGIHGRSLQKFTLKLCKHNLVHFIASDAHSLQKRPFLLKSAFKYIQNKMSTDYADFLKGNAVHVLNGTEFHTPPPVKFK